mmetsp:Transcript_59164/g.128458  ORF Transcript_59164/g.128458 Transcript_59164/m.128458 type:complete len:208 (-) Transcript_59164:1220-1843(-)
MQTEHCGGISRQLLLNVREVAFVVKGSRVRRLKSRSKLKPLEQLIIDKFTQVRVIGATIPRVRNMSSIHDLSEDVSNIIPRNDWIRFQVCLQHVGTDSQIPSVEGILSGPTLLSETTSSEHNRVEPAQREETGLELRLLTAPFNTIVGEVSPPSSNIRFNICRCLICHFHRSLHERLGHVLPRGDRRWFSREKTSEVFVSILLHHLQ